MRCLELGRLRYDDSFVDETILAAVLLVVRAKLLVRSFFGSTILYLWREERSRLKSRSKIEIRFRKGEKALPEFGFRPMGV